MSRARQSQDPSIGAETRTSPGGRVECTRRIGEANLVFTSCHITDVHEFGPAEGDHAADTVCAIASPG
jgi:hypothetical protein